MSIELTILGSSSATPTIDRFTSCQHLKMVDQHILIDCGEGAQMQMRRYKLKRSKLRYIFISHVHADHILGLPGLVFSMNLLHREEPLHIFAPKEMFELLDLFIKHSDTELRFTIIRHVTQAHDREVIFEDTTLRVTSFPLYHRLPTTGFLFEEHDKLKRLDIDACNKFHIPFTHFTDIKKGKDYVSPDGKVVVLNEILTRPSTENLRYAYCSDTQFNEKVAEEVEGVNLLYHEATFLHDKLPRALETMHSTAMQAGQIAKMANAQKLLIGHFSSRYDDLRVLLNEAREEFPNTELATEGKRFTVGEQVN
jgi:ribonuclease Z